MFFVYKIIISAIEIFAAYGEIKQENNITIYNEEKIHSCSTKY